MKEGCRAEFFCNRIIMGMTLARDARILCCLLKGWWVCPLRTAGLGVTCRMTRLLQRESETYKQRVACFFLLTWLDRAFWNNVSQHGSSRGCECEIGECRPQDLRNKVFVCSSRWQRSREIKDGPKDKRGNEKTCISLEVIAYISHQSSRGASHAICVFVT